MADDKPELWTITRDGAMAGLTSFTATVEYEGEGKSRVTFVGVASEYGAPVVMVTPANPAGVFVTDPSRFGPFGHEWVRRFFA